MRTIGLSLLEVLILAGVSVVVACLVAAIGGVIRYTTRPSTSRVSVLWLMKLGLFAGVPFAIIGMVSGYMTGLSRVGAISALVPACLTLIGGVGVYLFGKGGKSAVLAAFAVIDFAVMTLTGALIGGRERVETEQASTSLQTQEDDISRDFLLKQYKHGLGMDECTGPGCDTGTATPRAAKPAPED